MTPLEPPDLSKKGAIFERLILRYSIVFVISINKMQFSPKYQFQIFLIISNDQNQLLSEFVQTGSHSLNPQGNTDFPILNPQHSKNKIYKGWKMNPELFKISKLYLIFSLGSRAKYVWCCSIFVTIGLSKISFYFSHTVLSTLSYPNSFQCLLGFYTPSLSGNR